MRSTQLLNSSARERLWSSRTSDGLTRERRSARRHRWLTPKQLVHDVVQTIVEPW